MTETTYTDEKLASMLGKVQAALDRANHPNTPVAEAELSRATAERIMRKYRIEEEQLRQTKIASGTAAKPVEVQFIFLTDTTSPYMNHYYNMLLHVMHHVGIRGQYDHKRVEDETGNMIWAMTMNMIGFDSDVQVAQMLYTNLRLTFSEKLEPRIDRALSDEDNVYRLRSAGIERPRIGELMGWGRDAAQKVTKVYTKACKARGEDPKVVGKSLNVKTFRTSYADAFVAETRNRLRKMRNAASEDGALVLVGREEAVNEAFYDRYPHLRPKAVLDSPRESIYSQCDRCKKSKRGACKEHYIATGSYRPRPHSSTGWNAGTTAAREADLSRGGRAEPTGRLEG